MARGPHAGKNVGACTAKPLGGSAVQFIDHAAFCGLYSRSMDVFPPAQPYSPSVAEAPGLAVAIGGQSRVAEAGRACLRCAKPLTPELPFCGHCGTRAITTVEQ